MAKFIFYKLKKSNAKIKKTMSTFNNNFTQKNKLYLTFEQ